MKNLLILVIAFGMLLIFSCGAENQINQGTENSQIVGEQLMSSDQGVTLDSEGTNNVFKRQFDPHPSYFCCYTTKGVPCYGWWPEGCGSCFLADGRCAPGGPIYPQPK